MPNLQYTLDKLPVGLVLLDAEGRITSYSGVAADILGRDKLEEMLGHTLSQFHPKRVHSTIEWLLFQSREEGSRHASMLIHVPDTILQLRIVRMWRGDELSGFTVVMYDVTEVMSTSEGSESGTGGHPGGKPAGHPDGEAMHPTTTAMVSTPAEPPRDRRLVKLPVSAGDGIGLIDIELVVYVQAKGHYTQVHTRDKTLFSSMSIGQLESRLPAEQFLRVHRSHIVNLAHAAEVLKRDDQYVVVMEDAAASEIPVGRSKVSRLRELFGV